MHRVHTPTYTLRLEHKRTLHIDEDVADHLALSVADLDLVSATLVVLGLLDLEGDLLLAHDDFHVLERHHLAVLHEFGLDLALFCAFD